MRRSVQISIVGLLVFTGVTLLRAQGFGMFVGELVVALLGNGRLIELRQDFTYVDPSGKKWVAPKGTQSDGASIPQVFWTFIGGPLDGPYRSAAVIHDVGCKLKKEPWQEVHRMFYNAMRCAGVRETRALAMYWAVYRFGPRWEQPRGLFGKIGDAISSVFGAEREEVRVPPPPPPPLPTEEDFTKIEQLIEQQNLSTPSQVERLQVPQ